MAKTDFAFDKKQSFIPVSVCYFIILHPVTAIDNGYKGNHQSGKVEKDIFFIKQGIVRAYTSVDGKEITFWVGKEGATLVSMKGYVNDEPGYETMELMEDSVLYVLERKKLKELFSEDLHIANWGRRYAEMELLATEERLISMLSAIA